MNWQEYEEAVAELYEQIDDFGHVSRNVMMPDKITGQSRQIDVLIELNAKGHSIKIVVDAKFLSVPADVRDVESVLALANAVGANKAVIVAANGWTEPAKKKADHAGCDFRLLSLEDALDLIVPDKWKMCPSCEADCIVLDQVEGITLNGAFSWWLAGQCRACKCAQVHCQACGTKTFIDHNSSMNCSCGHWWSSIDGGVAIEFFVEGQNGDAGSTPRLAIPH